MRPFNNLSVEMLLGFCAVALVLFIALLMVGAGDLSASTGSTETGTKVKELDDATRARVVEAYGRLPLFFIQNDGQLDKKVKFYTKSSGSAIYFTQEGMYISLVKQQGKKEAKTEAMSDTKPEAKLIKLSFLGGNPNPEIVAEGRLEGKVNYFIGNDPKKWKTDIPTYSSVLYKEVYKGIDIRFYGNQRQLEYDVIVKPGADPSKVKIVYEGIEGLRVNDKGEMEVVVKNSRGEEEIALIQHKPIVYQEIDRKRKELDGSFAILKNSKGKAVYAFNVPEYDKTRPLVIDPVLVYSTYLGGSNYDFGIGIAVDSQGNAYVTGGTGSTDFPTKNAFQGSIRGSFDAFVTKLSPQGSLVYSTYLGGSGDDFGDRIAVDSVGNAYVTGWTGSTDFPTKNAYQGSYRAGDVFVTKLSPEGNSLIYSTYLGGSGNDEVVGIAVDSQGNAYVTGVTGSSDFPTKNAYQGSIRGFVDAFVTKIDTTKSGVDSLIYSTYLGGSNWDLGLGIAVDSVGNAYVTGWTNSTDFPTKNAYQRLNRGDEDAFVIKLSPSGSLIYSTYLGGSGNDEGVGIAVDSQGNAYVTGWTISTDFPTKNAYQGSYRGHGDAFVTKLSPEGSLVYSTYLGGSDNDEGRGIAVDSQGNAYVTGWTGSSDFPTKNTYQSKFGGGDGDAFVTKLSPEGNSLIYSTYLGGSSVDYGLGIAVDSQGNAYVTGMTNSTNFPTTQNVFQGTYRGFGDAFVTKLGETSCTPPFPDVACNHWAINYIRAIKDAGITTGYPDGTFRPEDTVTRAQIATFIIRAIEGEPTSYNPNPYFADVSPTHWAFKYVQRVRERNIAQGYPGTNLYGPEDEVTREQMAKMLIMGLVSQGRISEPPSDYCLSGSPFPDVEQDRWSCRFIKRLKELGITTGYPDGTFRPENAVKRSEMAAFIYRAFLRY